MSTNQELTVSLMIKGEEAWVNDLFNETFHKNRSVDDFRNFLFNNVYTVETFILRLGVEKIGSAFRMKLPISYFGQREWWYHAGDTMVSEKFRGHGYSYKLADGLYQDDGCTYSIAGIEKPWPKLPHIKTALINIYALSRQSLGWWFKTPLKPKDIAIETIQKFTAQHDHFLNTIITQPRKIMIWRDREYLNWRYQPYGNVTIEKVIYHRGQDIIGYSIIENQDRQIIISEIECLNQQDYSTILRCIYNFSRQQKAKIIKIACVEPEIIKQIVNLGFKLYNQSRAFFRVVGDSKPPLNEIANLAHWHVSFGDRITNY